jgi:hypothetical protein
MRCMAPSGRHRQDSNRTELFSLVTPLLGPVPTLAPHSALYQFTSSFLKALRLHAVLPLTILWGTRIRVSAPMAGLEARR